MDGICTVCGAPLDKGASFCTNCGASVVASEGLAGSASEASPSTAAFDPSVTTPVTDAPVAAPAPIPPTGAATSVPPTTAVPQSFPQSTPAPFTPSTQPMQTMQPAMPYGTKPTAAANGRKTWIIVGIAAAVVIVVAVVVIAMTLMGGGAKHRVTFETAGGTPVASSEVEGGTAINEPAAPTRSDYRFDGWYLDSTYTSKVVFPYTVNDDTVLYAKWAEDKVTATTSGSSASATSASSSSETSTSASTTTNSSSGNTATLTVVGADGSTRTGTIHRSGTSQRVFADSNTRVLSQSEINALSDAEKCIAWNEIIASSNGYSFKNSGLRTYFAGCSWYHANPGASAGGDLSSAGRTNVDNLQASCDSWWLHLASY